VSLFHLRWPKLPTYVSRAQHAVLTQKLGVKKVFCVIGFSMGAQQVNVFVESNDGFANASQAYYWSVVYPDFLERYVFDDCKSKVTLTLNVVKIHPHLWICSN
jgi:hypothetical protein